MPYKKLDCFDPKPDYSIKYKEDYMTIIIRDGVLVESGMVFYCASRDGRFYADKVM